MIELNRIYHQDCLEGMKEIADKSIDMILCDLPYGTSACKWDSIIPLDKLWEAYKRILKPGGAIVLTCQQPFTSQLIASNMRMFKYCWVWNKKHCSSPLNAKFRPLSIHEDIAIFCDTKTTYNKQMRQGQPRVDSFNYIKNGQAKHGKPGVIRRYSNPEGLYNPVSILEVSNGDKRSLFHPTQKPVALFEYLIRTYTNEGETVLDNCMGSGTTAIACINTGRNFIGFETELKYVNIAYQRIEDSLLKQAA